MKLSSSNLLFLPVVWLLSTFFIVCNTPDNATDSIVSVSNTHKNPADLETTKDTAKPVNPKKTTNRCSELAGSVYEPITIEKIIALGRDSSGTVHIIDQCDNDAFPRHRAFVSKNDTLFRKKIRGSSIHVRSYYRMSVEGVGRYIFKNDSVKWNGFYVCTGTNCREYDSILNRIFRSKLERDSKEKGETMDKLEEGWQLLRSHLDSLKSNYIPLDKIEQSDIQDFKIKNFEPVTRIDQFATLEDGSYLLISSDGNNISGDRVVHFGKKKDFKLREFLTLGVGTFSYRIIFLIDSLQANAYFESEQIITDSFPMFREGPAYLILANDTLPLKRCNPSREVLEELGFSCTHTIK